MVDSHLNIQLLHASVDPDDQVESEFRILINGRSVKYITIDPGIYEPDDMCFGHISLDPATQKPHFATASKTDLPGITDIWHPVQIDLLNLHVEQELRSNVLEVRCDHFNSTVVAKFARFPWEVPQFDFETSAYKWIDGQDVGPRFLGHLTEEGRVVGFLVAHVPHAKHPTPEDLSVCRLALSNLHRLGVRHGDVNRHNFLVHSEKATLIDFENATRDASPEALDEELHSLEASLRDTSGLGGVVEGSEF